MLFGVLAKWFWRYRLLFGGMVFGGVAGWFLAGCLLAERLWRIGGVLSGLPAGWLGGFGGLAGEAGWVVGQGTLPSNVFGRDRWVVYGILGYIWGGMLCFQVATDLS